MFDLNLFTHTLTIRQVFTNDRSHIIYKMKHIIFAVYLLVLLALKGNVEIVSINEIEYKI